MASESTWGCLDSEEEHPFQKAFNRAQRALRFRFSRPGLLWKTQRWLGLGTEGQLRRDIEVIDSNLFEIVEQALAQRAKLGKGEEKTGSDIVSPNLDRVSNSPDAEERQFGP